MADNAFWLFDTVPFGTAVNTTHTLFQVAQGADATHTKQYTNMRASGSLPQNEKMVVKAIHATLWNAVPEADLFDIFDGCYLELTVSDELLFRVPLVYVGSKNSYGGALTQAAAANNTPIGRDGNGLMLTPNVNIIGGDSFKVEVFQQNALAAVENMWITLEGILTR